MAGFTKQLTGEIGGFKMVPEVDGTQEMNRLNIVLECNGDQPESDEFVLIDQVYGLSSIRAAFFHGGNSCLAAEAE